LFLLFLVELAQDVGGIVVVELPDDLGGLPGIEGGQGFRRVSLFRHLRQGLAGELGGKRLHRGKALLVIERGKHLGQVRRPALDDRLGECDPGADAQRNDHARGTFHHVAQG